MSDGSALAVGAPILVIVWVNGHARDSHAIAISCVVTRLEGAVIGWAATATDLRDYGAGWDAPIGFTDIDKRGYAWDLGTDEETAGALIAAWSLRQNTTTPGVRKP